MPPTREEKMIAYSEKLKDKAGILFVLGLTVLLAGLAIRHSSAQSVVWKPFQSMVQLKMPKWSGSGTLIAVKGGRGLILSCRHVAYKVGNPVELQWVTVGQQTEGEVVEVVPRTGRRGTDKWQNDLALIEADVPAGLKPIPVAKFDANNGPWTCIGFRGKAAYIAVTSEAKKVDDAIVLSALFWGGESGGAVLDKYGQLVGVIVASEDNSGSTGIAANGEALQALLEKYGKQY